jgi:hypothetical protein
MGKMYIHKFTCLRTGRVFEQFSKIVDISCGRIADYAVPKAALAPCFHVERKFLCHWRLLVPSAPKRPLLKDEYRNLVLPHLIDEVRPWCLAKIGNTAAQQQKLGVLKFRQIECEGNLPLEPWLYRVPICGNYIYWR